MHEVGMRWLDRDPCVCPIGLTEPKRSVS
jgi:hypothetical protein